MDSRGLFCLIGSFALISLSECCWSGSSSKSSTESPIVMEVLEKVNEELNLSRNGTSEWEDQIGLVSNIFKLLEEVLDENTTIPPGSQIRIDLGNIDATLAAVGVKNLTEQGYNFSNSNDDNTSNISEPQANIQIPAGGIASSNDTAEDVLVVTSVARTNGSEERNAVVDEGEYVYNVASSIVTLRLFRNGAGHGDVPDIKAVKITIPYENTTKDPKPFYFEEENVNTSNGRGLQWSTVGCNSECYETEGICEMNCNHATSFAVLQILGESKLSTRGNSAASILTTIGCVVSIISLIAALVIYFLLRSRIATEQYAIHSNLMVSLLISLCIFMTLSIEEKSEMICKFKQFLLQYFFSAAFCWMLCEGIHLYRKIIAVFESGTKFLRMYFCIGWALPLSFVLVSIICSTAIQGSKKRKPFHERESKPCFFSHEDGSIWYFLVPVLVVIVINTGILMRVTAVVVKASKLQAGKDTSQAMYQAKTGLRSALLLIPLLGCSYILGFLASLHGAFEFMYNIINSLQGFFIAVFYCLTNKEIRAAIGMYIQRSQDMSTIQASTTGSTVVNTSVRKRFMHNKVEPDLVSEKDYQEEFARAYMEEPREELVLEPPEIPADMPPVNLAKEPLEDTEYKPAEKPPEKHSEKLVEEPVDMAPDMYSEEPLREPAKVPVEEPLEELVLEPPEIPADMPPVNLAKEPLEDTDYKPAEKPPEKHSEKLVEELVNTAPDMYSEEPLREPAKDPVEEPREELVLEPPADVPAVNLTEEPLEYTEYKPAETPPEQHSEKLAEEPINRAPDIHSEEPLGETAKDPVEKPLEELVLESPEIPADMPAVKLTEAPLECTQYNHAETSPEHHSEKLAEEPVNRAPDMYSEEPLGEPAKDPVEEPLEEPVLEPPEIPADVPAEEPLNGSLEQPSEEPNERHDEELTEEPAEESACKPLEQPVKAPVKKSSKKPAKKRSQTSAKTPWH